MASHELFFYPVTLPSGKGLGCDLPEAMCTPITGREEVGSTAVRVEWLLVCSKLVMVHVALLETDALAPWALLCMSKEHAGQCVSLLLQVADT